MAESADKLSFSLSGKVPFLMRWVVGGLFVYAGALKLLDPAAFAIQLERYGWLPMTWLDPAAILLPLGEIAAGLATIANRRGGAESLGLLLLLFLAVLGHAWWSGLDIPCGCFTTEDTENRFAIQFAFGRDLVLLLGALYLVRRRRAGIVRLPADHGRNYPKETERCRK